MRHSLILGIGLFLFVVLFVSGPAMQAQPLSGEWTGDFALPGVTSSVSAIVESEGRLYVGGSFPYAGDALTSRLAYYDFTTMAWSALDPPTSAANLISALTVGPEGTLYIADAMTTGGGVTTTLLSYTPQTGSWAIAEGEVDGAVQTLVAGPDGALYVGGGFEGVGDLSSPYLARYDFDTEE